MSVFRRRRGAGDRPATENIGGEEAALRAALLGELPLDAWTSDEPAEPWATFAAALNALTSGDQREAINRWRSITSTEGYESRHYVQAWGFLRAHGERPDDDVAKRVYGVVIEHWVDTGFDRVAAYADRRARYFNHGGVAVVWERPYASLDGLIDEVVAAGQEVAAVLGAWNRPEPPPPPKANDLRINLLTPSGLHFGNGPVEGMYKQAVASRVLASGVALMKALIATSRASGST